MEVTTLQEVRKQALIRKANKLLDRIESNLRLIVNYSKTNGSKLVEG